MKGYVKGGGPKSRGSFKIGFCMKEDCKNRERPVNKDTSYCDMCIKFSLYVKK